MYLECCSSEQVQVLKEIGCGKLIVDGGLDMKRIGWRQSIRRLGL